MRKPLALIGLVIGVGALLLQFVVAIPEYLDQEYSLIGALLKYFSYFTILTNIVIVLIYLGALAKGQRWLAPFRSPINRSTAAGAILLVMVFFHFFIAPTLTNSGPLFLSDTILHYATPVLYLVWFALFNRSGTLKWSDLPKMLIFPAVYLIWIMGRGAITGEHPYAVLETETHGYAKVALGILGNIIALTAFNAFAIATDKSLLLRETT